MLKHLTLGVLAVLLAGFLLTPFFKGEKPDEPMPSPDIFRPIAPSNLTPTAASPLLSPTPARAVVNTSRERTPQPSEPSYPDRDIVLLVAAGCHNSEHEISKTVDEIIVKIRNFTGKTVSRSEFMYQAMALMGDLEKEKNIPGRKKGKYDFSFIAASLQLWYVQTYAKPGG